MKKTTKIIYILLILIPLSYPNHGISAHHEWGTSLDKVEKSIPSTLKYIKFSPKEKPKYKNKIMNYIINIDDKLIDKIVILRIVDQPELEYLFVNKKLYTIVENYKNIPPAKEKELNLKLNNSFGKPYIQQDKNLSISSYKNNNTKVLFYKLKLPNGQYKCKVYYYTIKLFRLLIME